MIYVRTILQSIEEEPIAHLSLHQLQQSGTTIYFEAFQNHKTCGLLYRGLGNFLYLLFSMY